MALPRQPSGSPASQGDTANKRLFSHPRMVADLLRLLGEDWVDELDLDRLERLPAEHVADDRRARRQDMPWRAPFKPAAGQGAGAALLVHLEFQSRPDPFMAERMLEYAALLRRDLLRAGAGLAAGGVVPAHLPLVVYNGRAPWNAPLRVEERTAWAPAGLAALQPRFALRLVDASAYKGDHTSDGNAARAWLALDAADTAGLLAALERAARTLASIGDAGLSRSFEVWSDGVLRPRFGDRTPSLANTMETPTMLAETLREWEERLISEGRRTGREEGRRTGREEGQRIGREEGRRTGREEGQRIGHEEGRRTGHEEGRREERARLRRLAEQRLDKQTADALARLLATADDASERPPH